MRPFAFRDPSPTPNGNLLARAVCEAMWLGQAPQASELAVDQDRLQPGILGFDFGGQGQMDACGKRALRQSSLEAPLTHKWPFTCGWVVLGAAGLGAAWVWLSWPLCP